MTAKQQAKPAFKFLDKGQLDKAITSIAKRGAQLDKDIQTAALSALKLLADHGGVEWINKLYLAMPNGSRRSSLAQWFIAFGACVANTDDATKRERPFVYAKDKTTDLEGAAAVQWYDMKKEPEPDEVFDIQKALASILAKAKKAGKVNDEKLLKHLQAFAKAE
ncbi:hypothetical protein HOR55_gp46 [Ralstonia phage RS-PII-1]|uniref:Uncharacterized protein n=1 Tax=Ralstonia phage RS-PII-1 TaxID=1932892 RepID=A0A1L7DQL1_9CAUD|nr:hypothetical protein HOR55_gp46 [Ralstonia phage RS-PII-1]APU00333.1 hypothetical protein [Ralstonia phage RS-PII-1]